MKTTKNIIFIFFALLSCLTYLLACKTNEECNKGQCKQSECVCDTGFVTFNNVTCNYKQKEKLTAFLLSFFAGNVGADWFYLASGNTGYIVAGVFKLITGFFFIAGSCFICCITCCAQYKGHKNTRVHTCEYKGFGYGNSIFTVIMIICSLTNSIWYVVDWIRILTDTFNDGNGYDLKPW
jgi:TM2 domain-containing membrane protein YozV